MIKVKMPDPVMFDAAGLNGELYSHGYSAEQMEAYATARENEALEKAIRKIKTGDARDIKKGDYM